MWWTAATLGLQAAGGLAKFFGNRSAERMKREALDEELRRFRAENARTLSTAQAVGAASGIEFESQGLQTYLRDMAAEFDRQALFMRRVGRQQIGAASRSSLFGLVGDFGSALTQFGQANNWFRQRRPRNPFELGEEETPW